MTDAPSTHSYCFDAKWAEMLWTWTLKNILFTYSWVLECEMSAILTYSFIVLFFSEEFFHPDWFAAQLKGINFLRFCLNENEWARSPQREMLSRWSYTWMCWWRTTPKHFLAFSYQLNVILSITLVIFLPQKFLPLGQELSADWDHVTLIKMNGKIRV